MTDPRCFFEGVSPCDGWLVRAHIVPRQLLRRECRYGLVREHGAWRRLGRYEDRYDLQHVPLQELIDDPRCWTAMCGGACGISGHHGEFDGGRLRVARADLPAGVEEFAVECGLVWWLDRRYGPVREAA